MTEIESPAESVALRNEQAPVLAVEVKDSESPVIRVVVGKKHERMYTFEKRWRVIWTDGRQLPKDPDPRWYGYSVGKWEDDSTFVVQTVGMDDRTWLDDRGDPHSDKLHMR